RILQDAFKWAMNSLRERFKDDPQADDKIEAVLNGDPGLLVGYADQTSDKLAAENRRTGINDWANLQKWIRALRNYYQDKNGLVTTSWFITNDRGDQLARDPLDIETLFLNFSNRDYFYGSKTDLEKLKPGEPPRPIERPRVSHVYESKATHHPT